MDLAGTSNSNIRDVQDLSSTFRQGLDIFNKLESSEEPNYDLDIQYKVKKCIKTFETATILCSLADVFSNNEGIEEVATSDLQYFLLPALLGTLHLKLIFGERRNIVEVSEVYFKDFIKRCNDYNLCKYEFECDPARRRNISEEPGQEMTEMEEITVLAKRRAIKISRFKEKQELKKRLSELKTNSDNEHCDEEIKRKYFLTMIQLYIYEAIDELISLELEKILLDHMDKLRKNEKPKPKRRPGPPLRPVVIITKDLIQKNVLGAGYPSLPTMSMKEFYEKRMNERIFPDPAQLPKTFMRREHNLEPPKEFESETKTTENEYDTDDYHILEALRQRDKLKDYQQESWRK